MKNTISFLLISIIFSFSLVNTSLAQDCSCEANFEWVKKTFEENDAGFSYALEKKGEDAYAQHTKIVKAQLASIKDEDKEGCANLIREWLSFFRSGHIGIGVSNPEDNNDAGEKPDPDAIRAQYKDWEKHDFNREELEKYFIGLKEPGFEGVWVSEPYIIGIVKENEDYIGFVIEADGVYWTPGQVKLKLKAIPGEDAYKATYYMRDHSPREFEKATIIGNNFLKMGFVTLKRYLPALETPEYAERYYQVIEARNPFIKEISDQSLLLRIPSFSYSEKEKIDKVIEENHEKILSTENLIIDLRNNGGGSDISYSEIIPYLYTNPIRVVGMELLSTPLNNKRMEEFIEERSSSEEEKEEVKNMLKKLNDNLGEFVNFNDKKVFTEEMDTIYPYPKNVAIIIHEGNGSTTEQFLLAAKQSKKVKLFGTTTAGVLDISNMYFVKTPCKDLELAYSLSRSYRIPDMAIDDKGIQPDYYIDKTVPEYKWIDFVRDIVEQ